MLSSTSDGKPTTDPMRIVSYPTTARAARSLQPSEHVTFAKGELNLPLVRATMASEFGSSRKISVLLSLVSRY